MIKLSIALWFVLLASVVVLAQSPCDVVAPTVYREPRQQLASLKLGWCFAAVDTEGVPIAEPIGFALQVNGGPDIDLGIVPPLTLPNALGVAYYQAQTPALVAGVLTLKAYTGTLGVSAQSDPITLTLTGSPRKPQNTTIVR